MITIGLLQITLIQKILYEQVKEIDSGLKKYRYSDLISVKDLLIIVQRQYT